MLQGRPGIPGLAGSKGERGDPGGVSQIFSFQELKQTRLAEKSPAFLQVPKTHFVFILHILILL